MHLKDLGEFNWINRIAATVPPTNSSTPSILRGIGDDCAVWQWGDEVGLISTDTLVESVHFRLDWMTCYQIGWKMVAVNLSDIAAMAGTPQFIVVALSIPPHITVEQLDDLYQGILDCTQSYGVSLVGGDTTKSPDYLVGTITVVGKALPNQVVYRKGGRVGDSVYVSGNPGHSSLGLWMYTKNHHPRNAWEQSCLEAHTTPIAPIELGRWLAENHLVNAMIDTSDGLSQDCMRLVALNSFGLEFNRAHLLPSEEMIAFCEEFQLQPDSFILHGGEDYGLCFISSHRLPDTFIDGTPLRCIGQVIDPPGLWIRENNQRYPLSTKGYDHFQTETMSLYSKSQSCDKV